MLIPTQDDIKEFRELHQEFKDYGNHKIEINDDTIELLTKNLGPDDPLRKESQRLKRHNRYSRLCSVLAPYFFEKAVI